VLGQLGTLASVVFPAYVQVMLIVPVMGMDVIVNWVAAAPLDGMVTLVAEMEKAVLASVDALEIPQLKARMTAERRTRR
jgi:hypothetical protein